MNHADQINEGLEKQNLLYYVEASVYSSATYVNKEASNK